MQLPLFTVRKRIFGHFPWGVFLLLIAWSAMGLLNLYSATFRLTDPGLPTLFRSQLLWVCLGLVIFFWVTWMDYHLFFRFAYPLYIGSLILLALVFVAGRSVAGQQNWVVVAGFSFQPSEIAKLTLLLVLARYYSVHFPDPDRLYSWKDLIRPLGFLLPPLILVLLQKDLGGTLFFVLLFATLTFFIRIPLRYLVVVGVLAVLVGWGGYHFVLKGYQKDRIRVFLHPESDPRGKGYHLVQSKIAVGSGGILGKGYLKGNINKLKYLPERHTDFIFPVLAEEWGFLGAFLTLGVMAVFLFVGLESALQCKDLFGSYLVVGVVGIFFWQIVVNLGGVLGLMPLTGVPLPLFSYGGSSILTMMIAVGILVNVRMRRFVF
jgi:rod shape determining protein RodA